MAGILLTGQVGPPVVADGATPPFRQGRSAEQIIQQLHGRFYEQNLRGNLFMGGMTFTSISAATFSFISTQGATSTPIIGLWNPLTSKVNLTVLQATLNAAITAATNTGLGGLVWVGSVNNAAITTGTQGINCATLAAGGTGKFYPGTALTGLTNNLALLRGSPLCSGSASSFSFVGTAVGQVTAAGGLTIEPIEGGIIVPPGGVLALMATATPVAHSATSGIIWEETPIN